MKSSLSFPYRLKVNLFVMAASLLYLLLMCMAPPQSHASLAPMYMRGNIIRSQQLFPGGHWMAEFCGASTRPPCLNSLNSMWYYRADDEIIATGDFNGDGRDDYIIRNQRGLGIISHRELGLTTLMGKIEGNFVTLPGITGDFVWRNFDHQKDKIAGVGDFNDDGRDDIIVMNDWGIGILTLRGNKLFALAVQRHKYFGPTDNGRTFHSRSARISGIGDFDHNERDDFIIIGLYGIAILKLQGSELVPLMAQPHQFITIAGGDATGFITTRIDRIPAIGDFDNDGQNDFIITTNTTIAILTLDGSSLRALMITPKSSTFTGAVSGLDFNARADKIVGAGHFKHHSRDDILITGPSGIGILQLVGKDLSVMTGQHNRSSIRGNTRSLGFWKFDYQADQMGIGDFNHDGLDEIAIYSAYGLGILSYQRVVGLRVLAIGNYEDSFPWIPSYVVREGYPRNQRDFNLVVGRPNKLYPSRSQSLLLHNRNGFEPFYTGDRFYNSDIPIVVIDANDVISGDHKQLAKMRIYSNAGRGQATNNFRYYPERANFSGNIGIKIRGHSSSAYLKKQYTVETWTDLSTEDENEDLKVSLLGMHAESDWVLQGPFVDKSLMRNYLVYTVSNNMGRYAPKAEFVEVFLNESDGPMTKDDYVGVYVFMEKIKRDRNRVNVNRSTGYILEVSMDRVREEEGEGFRTFPYAPGHTPYVDRSQGNTDLAYIYPKPGRINGTQMANITEDLFTFENKLRIGTYEELERIIDIDSFVDFFLINEFFKNQDGFRLSTYLHKIDSSHKLTMGPVWDFNLSMGNTFPCVRNRHGWYHATSSAAFPSTATNICNRDIPFWWGRLLEYPDFQDRLRARWDELIREPLGALSETHIHSVINDAKDRITIPAQRKNFQRWPILGMHVDGHLPRPTEPETYTTIINDLEEWLNDRRMWITDSIHHDRY